MDTIELKNELVEIIRIWATDPYSENEVLVPVKTLQAWADAIERLPIEIIE